MSILTQVMTKLLISEIWVYKIIEPRRHFFERPFLRTKTFITFEQRKIEFFPLYVFYLFFEEESNDVSLFKMLQLLFFKKKLHGGGVNQKMFFVSIES